VFVEIVHYHPDNQKLLCLLTFSHFDRERWDTR
jgi:hypothetical protein